MIALEFVALAERDETDELTAALNRLLAVTEANLERRAQLEHALQSRIAIEQAKGIIAERYGLDVEEAFQLLRRAARQHRMKIHDLVAAVRPGAEMPSELEAVRLAAPDASNKAEGGGPQPGTHHRKQSAVSRRE